MYIATCNVVDNACVENNVFNLSKPTESCRVHMQYFHIQTTSVPASLNLCTSAVSPSHRISALLSVPVAWTTRVEFKTSIEVDTNIKSSCTPLAAVSEYDVPPPSRLRNKCETDILRSLKVTCHLSLLHDVTQVNTTFSPTHASFNVACRCVYPAADLHESVV